MSDAVEEIGIAEGDVLRTGRDLAADIFQHHLTLDDAKPAVVYRHDGAVTAQVLACLLYTSHARRHLVEHYSEREQVGSGVQFLGADLFRRHVCDRAHGSAGAGERLLQGLSLIHI